LNRVHGLQDGRLSRIGKGSGQFEAFHTRMEVRRVKANNFGVLAGWFRKQVLVRRDHIGDPHPCTEGVAAGPYDMALDENRVLVVGHDRVDSDSIAIVDFKGLEFFCHFRSVFDLRDIHAQHRLFIMGHHALHFDVAQRGGWKKATGKFERTRQSLLIPQLVDRRAANHSFDSHFWADRRDLNGVAVFQPLEIRLDSMEEKVIHIHGLN